MSWTVRGQFRAGRRAFGGSCSASSTPSTKVTRPGLSRVTSRSPCCARCRRMHPRGRSRRACWREARFAYGERSNSRGCSWVKRVRMFLRRFARVRVTENARDTLSTLTNRLFSSRIHGQGDTRDNPCPRTQRPCPPCAFSSGPKGDGSRSPRRALRGNRSGFRSDQRSSVLRGCGPPYCTRVHQPQERPWLVLEVRSPSPRHHRR